jgi:PPOX class probable F420-dependent enzyme
MPKRRELVRMSDEELWTFIDGQKTIQVATVNRDGTPHVVPLWFATEGRTIVLETFSKSQKVKNLERDPRITLLFEDGLEYPELRGASLRARAALVGDVDEVHRLHMKVLIRNTPEIPEEVLEKSTRAMAPKKTAILIRPDAVEHVMSWDHGKLDGSY